MTDPVKVDAHVHLYRNEAEGRAEKEGYQVWEYGEKTDVQTSECVGTIDELVIQMDATGISKAVVVNLFSAIAARESALAAGEKKPADVDAWVIEEMIGFNRWSCELARRYEGLVPFVAIDPAALPGEEGANHLRDMVGQGAAGVKLHGAFQMFQMGDQRLWPTYAVCQELGIAIICHSGPDRGNQGFAEPQTFGRMLKAFPDLRVVLAHLGGGVWGQALEIAQTYPNAYFDCCEIMEWTDSPNGPTPKQLGQLIKDIGAHRVMMGSDFPWYDLDHSIDRVMSLPVLSMEEKTGIVGANAMDILGL